MDFITLADDATINRTISALEKRNIAAISLDSGEQALARLIELIPEGSEIFSGTSMTLNAIGFNEYLSQNPHRYLNLRNLIAAESDPDKRQQIRLRTTTTDYYIGSVHAVTETGQVVVASRSGSQLAPYVYGASQVIWVVGTQKIVPTLDDALVRIRDHVLPLEDARMKSTGGTGSIVGKLLVFEWEQRLNRITLLLVKDALGF